MYIAKAYKEHTGQIGDNFQNWDNIRNTISQTNSCVRLCIKHESCMAYALSKHHSSCIMLLLGTIKTAVNCFQTKANLHRLLP